MYRLLVGFLNDSGSRYVKPGGVYIYRYTCNLLFMDSLHTCIQGPALSAFVALKREPPTCMQCGIQQYFLCRYSTRFV